MYEYEITQTDQEKETQYHYDIVDGYWTIAISNLDGRNCKIIELTTRQLEFIAAALESYQIEKNIKQDNTIVIDDKEVQTSMTQEEANAEMLTNGEKYD
jgi:hypothetical protein